MVRKDVSKGKKGQRNNRTLEAAGPAAGLTRDSGWIKTQSWFPCSCRHLTMARSGRSTFTPVPGLSWEISLPHLERASSGSRHPCSAQASRYVLYSSGVLVRLLGSLSEWCLTQGRLGIQRKPMIPKHNYQKCLWYRFASLPTHKISAFYALWGRVAPIHPGLTFTIPWGEKKNIRHNFNYFRQ